MRIGKRRKQFWSSTYPSSNGGSREMDFELKRAGKFRTDSLTYNTAYNENMGLVAPGAGKSNYINLVRYQIQIPGAWLGEFAFGLSLDTSEAGRISQEAVLELGTTFAVARIDSLGTIGEILWVNYDIALPGKGVKVTGSDVRLLMEYIATSGSQASMVGAEVFYHEE